MPPRTVLRRAPLTNLLKHIQSTCTPTLMPKPIPKPYRALQLPPDNPQSQEYVSGRCRSISANSQHNAGVRERPALSCPPPNLVVPTPSPKNLSKRNDPGPQDWVGNMGGPAVSGQSLCHQVPQKLSLNGRLGQSQPQPACTLETLNHKGLLRYAQEEFNINGSGWNTQTIIRHLQLAQAQQALQMGSLWRPSLINMFPARPIKVGGGWTQNVISESSKQQRLSIPAEDAANEMEEHSPATGNDVWLRITAERIVQACGTWLARLLGLLGHLNGAFAPPPSRQSTPSTIIEVALPRLPSPKRVTDLPSSPLVVEVSPEDLLPASKISVRGPTHTSIQQIPFSCCPTRPPRTYACTQRSHLPLPTTTSQAAGRCITETGSKNNISGTSNHNEDLGSTEEPPNPTEPGSKSGPPQHASTAEQEPLPCGFEHPQGPKRLPKAKRVFNESVRCKSQGATQCGSPTSRPPDVAEDNEEDLAQAKARAKSRNLPLARDFLGLERQVLIMAKVHLFGYLLVQGIYQTQATFFQWASAVHHATWQMELPDQPYKRPPNAIFEIMVNNIATLQGKTKERLCEFVESVCGFEQSLTNQNIIQKNLGIFNKIYPNTFHCKNWDSCKGDYKNPDIGRCVALAFFHSPGLVGVMYPDYFQEMPITIVAFALAIWLYCIEEWENGWRQNGNLGMAAMQEKYKAQLAGLKELCKVAPRRLRQLQMEWRDYVAEYLGALFVPESDSNAGLCSTRICLDTPKPEDCNAISTDEMETHLFKNA
ncbi:hypothetical protein RHS01_05171 [Rhizoctonia solani]|uniref:DUF6532 domain-containing protein n=1 Tax=Rhizoctonia solani TaxID=456999 RepID=A0A8H7IBI4_9AGAM|nr:hypothetical protein RHS01_05171 [Rhizoctonia solani]